jgi:hypothetical protein
MREIEIDRGDRVLRVRDAGEPGGTAVIYFQWLSRTVLDARLVMREGEGHFGIYEHLGEMPGALTAPAPAGAG